MKEIKLSKYGKNRGNIVTQVDDEDYEYLNQFNWYAHYKPDDLCYYAKRNINKKMVSMHTVLMNPAKGFMVDHIDQNTLNNQKVNLRICTNSQNQRNRGKPINNTSGYKGVSLLHDSYTNKNGITNYHDFIRAIIIYNKKIINLGCFKTKKDAAMAYDEAAKRYHGEFANLNFKELK